MKTLHASLGSLLIVSLSGFSIPSFADDTELYTQSAPVTVDNSNRPNLLFILDNSGSMNTKDMVIGYDPLKNNAAIMGTRIYVLKDALYRILDEAHNVNIGLERFTYQTGAGGNDPILYPIKYVDESVSPDVISYDVPVKEGNDDAEEGLSDEPVILVDKNIEMTRRMGTEIMFSDKTITVSTKIATNADDAREMLGSMTGAANASGKIYATSEDALALGSSTSRGEQIIGLRFANLNIPKDATIVASWIEFTALDSYCNCSMKPVNIKIEAAKVNNAPSFTETSSSISKTTSNPDYYPLTTANVEWNNIDAWIGEQVYQSPDLSNMVQEIITNAGSQWNDPNGMMFRLTRNPAYSATATQNKSEANRRFYSFGESATKAPVLKVVYSIDPAYAGKTGIAATSARQLNSIEQRISNSANDAYEFLGNYLARATTTMPVDYIPKKGAVIANSTGSAVSGFSLGEGQCILDSESKYRCTGQKLLGVRFPNLNVPKASKIIKADVTFTSLKLDSDGALSSTNFPLNVNIFAQDSVNPLEFSGGTVNTSKWGLGGTVNNDLSNRLPLGTNPKVVWNAVPLEALQTAFSTPNLATLIEPIIAKDDWNIESNALVFLFKPTIDAGTSKLENITTVAGLAGKAGSRVVYDYSDGSNGTKYAAKLKMLYGQEIKTATQKVGLRFQGVNIPRGTTIKRAYLKFTSGLSSSSAANLTIKAQTGDSQPFETTTGNISGRSTSSASVSWNASSTNNPMTAWTYGNVYRSPDLKDVVQEVVSRSDWCGGSSMGFVISSTDDTSVRNVLSYDSEPTSAPVLHVEFNPTTVPTNTCIKQVFSTSIKDSKDDGVQTLTRDNAANDNNVFLMSTVDDKILNMVSTKKASTNSLTKRIVGVRFQDIPIKKGANIIDAKLVFTGITSLSTGESSTATAASLNAQAALKIKGEVGNAKPFEETVDNFGNFEENISTSPVTLKRAKTAAEVAWDLPATSPWEVNKRYKTPSLKTIVQEIVNSANWEVYSNMAFFITSNDETSLRKAASFDQSPTIAPVLEITVDGLLGEGGFTQTVRTHIKDEIQLMEKAVNGLVADEAAYTPIVDALYEGALYYRGSQVSGSANDRRNKRFYRVSHKLSHNGPIEGIEEATCSPELADYPFSEGCKGEKIQGGFAAVYNSPISTGCQPNHIILLSDGAPTKNTVAGAIKGAGGAQGISLTCEKPPIKYYGTASSSQEYGQNQECGPELAAYLATTDNKSSLPGSIIKTHTIGLKLGDNTGSEDNSLGEKYLQAIAKAGQGKYYRADTAKALLLAFQDIIAKAMTESTSFAAPAVSVNVFNRLYHNNEIYFTFFKPSNKVAWEGNVKRYNLCSAKTGCASPIVGKNGTAAVGSDGIILSTAQDVWSTLADADGAKVTMAGAGGVLPAPDNRKIYSNVAGDEAIALADAVNSVTTGNSSLTTTMLNVATEASPDAARTELINWIRGYTDAATGALRNWRFGDPLHSTPGVFTYGKDDATKEPKTKVIVNTNEGAIRMLDGKTGVEDWMFIPRDMLAIQKQLKNNEVSSQRLYGIDGRPVVWVRDNNYNGIIESANNDSVWVFTGMRRGGRNIYALQVTPDTSSPPTHQPRLVWTIFGGQSIGTQGDFTKLGQTWSTPIVTKVRYNGATKTVLLFAGGFDATTQDVTANYQQQASMGNTIYMVDPLDGGKLLWMAGNANNTSANLKLNGMNYSFPSDLTVIDGNGDGLTDRIYVGDTGGQLWRVDIRDVAQGKAVGGRLAILGDSSTDAGKRRFFYPPDVTLLTDAKYSPYAQDFDLVLVGSGHRPNPLNKTIQDRLYAFRDRQTSWLIGDANNGKGGNAVQDTPAFLDQTVAGGSAPAVTKFFTITEDKLYDATTEVLNTSTDQATLNGAKADVQKSLGWKVNLKDATAGFIGEKALAKPFVLSGVAYYTTFVPPQPKTGQQEQEDACNPFDPGTAKAYAINILTGEGGIAGQPRSEEIGSGMPAGAMAIFTENGMRVVAAVGGKKNPGDDGGDGSGSGLVPLNPETGVPRETVYWIEE